MALVSINDVSIRFNGPPLLDDVSAKIESGQRIGLLGRNGAGKTTLLRMLAGDHAPDNGSISLAPTTRVARLVQDVPADLSGPVNDVVIQGVDAKKLADPSQRWECEHEVEKTLTNMQLDGASEFETLSSGMKRRVLLARSIVSSPDVLLLDEPTNHLDIPSILWLEDFLSRWDKTLVFITHDRSFLQKLATRIWEIDRGRLFDWSCDYATFLKRKEQALETEAKQNALFDKRLAEEEAWIRQGIKARRTRNEGRVRALKAMRVERQQRIEKIGTASMRIVDAEKSGQLVAEIEEVSFAYGEHEVLRQFSTLVLRGDKIGIIGPNGAGKSTLLKLMLGRLKPESGSVRLGTRLQIAYFDQLRDTLDPESSVQDNVGEGSEQIQVAGKPKHVLGYLQDFLFTPERARTKVKFLSGGERNRALLAKLMTKPANVLVMDEPTNDLDAETLELLEELLIQFEGTVLLVSHDRTFLNHVVTSTIVFEEDQVRQYAGGYDDWQRTAAARESSSSTQKKKKNSSDAPEATPQPLATGSDHGSKDSKRKLSYKEKRELEALPERIESLEAQVSSLHSAMAEPDYYQRGPDELAEDAVRLRQVEEELENAYARWEELDH
ncbi:MAG: ATP-binding cassette domain-containing protein [Planctomycetota bacterium]